jgi:uncharacterized cupin superfamily protein
MHTKALLSKRLLRRVCTLSIVLFAAMFATNAKALGDPKVTITYSLKTADGGAYWQKVSATPLGAGDAEFVYDTDDSMNQNSPATEVNVTRADPLEVTIEYTADEFGNIADGPVELTQTDFGRTFILTAGTTVVTTVIDTVLTQIGTGTLSGSTITWDFPSYEETVVSGSDCVGDLCFFAGPWPKILDATDRPVDLPTFTLSTQPSGLREFVSDNGTPLVPDDDIPRPDDSATVVDTWYAVPEPSGEVLLLSGVVGLMCLARLRERGGVSTLFANHR